LGDAEGLVKVIGDGGVFSQVVIAGLVSSVITVKSTVGGVFKPAGRALSGHI